MRFSLMMAFILALLIPSRESWSYMPHADRVDGPVVGTVTNVLDGDTFDITLHVWIGEEIATHVRIAGIDAPELHGKCEKERDMARQARNELDRLVGKNKITLYDIRLEKYAGRVLATAKTGDGVDIGAHMLAAGLARPYRGEKRKTWCF